MWCSSQEGSPADGRLASRALPVAPLVQRQPAPGPTPPAAAAPGRKWKDVLADLVFAGISAPARVPALVQELLEVAETPGYDLDLLNDAMNVVAKLSKQGDITSADRLLEVIQRKFFMAYVTYKAPARAGAPLPQPQDLPSGGVLKVGGPVLGDPGALIAVAEDAARAGQHERAFKLFGAAHEILSYLALGATEKAKATTDVSKRDSRYRQFKGIYGEMREIYRFYFVLEAEALAAGDNGRAAEARGRASKLHEELKAKHTPFAESAAEIAETSQVTTPTGRPAFQFHGANFEKTDLTELPGHPFSADLLATGEGQEPQSLGLLQSSLMAQTEFQAEIAREPEIRKAFGKEAVDLNDSAKRLKVWRIMYAVYKGRGTGALGSLMALMGRYLKAHTYHTGFNVRDFGTSYLASEMPTDLADRLVRDCGVYALTVAWDVFQTVKAGDSKLKLSFTLATLLDHIILVITDKAADESYLVNNDQITKISRPVGYAPQFTRPRGMSPNVDLFLEDPVMPPPKAPDLDEEVAKQYALFRDLPYLVSPVNYLELGSTSDTASTFKTAAWQRYLAATQYMAKVPVDFSMLQDFSRESGALDQLVNELAPSAGNADAIAKWLQNGWPHITSLLVRFEQIGPKAFKNITPPATRPAGSRDSGAFRWPGSNHPLIRVALVLLRLRSLGRPLTNDQQKYLTYFETAFKELMDKSSAGRRSGTLLEHEEQDHERTWGQTGILLAQLRAKDRAGDHAIANTDKGNAGVLRHAGAKRASPAQMLVRCRRVHSHRRMRGVQQEEDDGTASETSGQRARRYLRAGSGSRRRAGAGEACTSRHQQRTAAHPALFETIGRSGGCGACQRRSRNCRCRTAAGAGGAARHGVSLRARLFNRAGAFGCRR